MPDDDQSPTIITGGQAGGVAFSAFGDDERKAERRARRKNLAIKTLAGAVVLFAVGAVAALTSNGGAKKAPAAAAAGVPIVGVVTKPVPPQITFVTADLGYAFYSDCKAQPNGDGCQAALYRTSDRAQHWHRMTLPPGAPVDPASWLGLQARGENGLLLAWQSGIAVSADGGANWNLVKVDADASTSQVAPSEYVVDNGANLVLVDPDHATGVLFRSPQKVEIPGGGGGELVDGQLWVMDPADVGLSTDGGLHWHVAPLGGDGYYSAPLVNSSGLFARLTGQIAGSTVGKAGDGGDVKATHVLFSTNRGTAWTSSELLAGPAVNGACTVYLDDGTLLGVASDKSSLLRLAVNGSAFALASPQPPTTPSCLSSHGQLVWGATQKTNQVIFSNDGAKSWTALQLPTDGQGIATPSPTPSAAK